MTNKEFQDVCAFALHPTNAIADADETVLHGCGLPDFKPVAATLEACARFVRWQCLLFNNTFDSEALTECQNIFRRKVTLIR